MSVYRHPFFRANRINIFSNGRKSDRMEQQQMGREETYEKGSFF